MTSVAMPVSRFCVLPALVIMLLTAAGESAAGQTFPTNDPVIQKMWEEGIDRSQTEALAHELVDFFGPRLAGSENLAASQEWLLEVYTSWGVSARKEHYGTWTGWRQGALHIDMIEPRVQSLEAELLAWSPGTNGPVEGDVVMAPEGLTAETLPAWLTSVRGKFVMTTPPERMCRAQQELKANAREETIQRLDSLRMADRMAWEERMKPIGPAFRREAVLDSIGVAGVLTSRWSGGWGVNKVFSTSATQAVGIDVSCEDYGLMYRLASSGRPVRLRVNADAEKLGEVPQFNVVAELKGSELPNEYVLLGAHLDSWHAGTGATDNGTGTITMLEAMRILKATYPNPRRTILVGHWGAEEMGLIGSGVFREDHPEVMEGLQVAFNQDNGTWRFEKIEGQGYLDADAHIPRWMSVVPTEISGRIELEMPGAQNNSGSDHSSFVCAGVPSFRFQSPYDEYRQYTWHTNRDTYDKIVFDDLKENATLAAMIAYMASEDPDRVGREKAQLPINPRTKEPRPWPECRAPRRSPR
ncbi:MAG: M20/M25/M40 family metallo-hydrolase [Rhodothermales bacterium]|nr:M20/M25/M40 family metallo-hydrolase [Rhodothermales bacterium]